MLLSDHCFIHCQLTIAKNPPITESVTYRTIKAIDLEAFKQDLELALSNQHQGNINEAVNFYNDKVKHILDTHAPEKTKVVKRSHNQPWFNDTIKQEIILRRHKERIFWIIPCPYTLNAFYQQWWFVNNIIKTAQRNFYINQLAEHHSDSKKILEIANKMLYRNEPLLLPPTDDTLKLVNDFNSFFIEKIDKIMTGLIPMKSHPVDPKYIESTEKCSIKCHQFHEIDLDETKRMIQTSATKLCEIDPMPTSLLKECIDIVTPTIMEIINLLLTTWIMPNQMKEALICPLLKKLDLDLLQFKNYRPISNLTFISKLIEHAVCDQLMDHAYKTGNLERLQCAYHSNHSTETALLKIKADILDNMDNQHVTGILLLDLSAALSILLPKNLLINHLFYRFGVCDKALGWIEIYLLDWTQKVKIGNTESTPAVLTQGVPQGTVFGPILYTLHITCRRPMQRTHGIDYHGYVDDTQNYHSFAPNVPGDQQKCITILESCVSDIRIWMHTNQLKTQWWQDQIYFDRN